MISLAIIFISLGLNFLEKNNFDDPNKLDGFLDDECGTTFILLSIFMIVLSYGVVKENRMAFILSVLIIPIYFIVILFTLKPENYSNVIFLITILSVFILLSLLGYAIIFRNKK